MGSCVSTQYFSSGSTLKQRRIGSSIQEEEEDDHVFLETTNNRSPPPVTENLNPQPSPSPNSIHSQHIIMDSIDDIFFDSQECLDSECEADYLSFNGSDADLAASDHENGFAEIKTVVVIDDEDKTQISKICIGVPPSPADKKKKLADFFEENLSDDIHDIDIIDINKKENQSFTSGIKHGQTVNKSERQKLVRSLSSCIPNLNKNMSISDRRRKAANKLPRHKQLTL